MSDCERQRWTKECDELEEIDRRRRSDQIYSKIKQIAGHGNSKRILNEIRENKREMITESVEIRNRWKQYIKELYDKNLQMMCDLGIEDKVDIQQVRC